MHRLIQITTVPHTLHFLIGQIGFMRQAGFTVETISSVPDGDGKLDFFLKHEPVPHYEVPMKRALSPFSDLVAVARLFQILRFKRPAIVHAHTPKAGLLAMLAARAAGVPNRAYHIHGLRFTTLTGWKRRLVIACEKLTCWLATDVFCVSESARAVAVAAGLAEKNKIQLLAAGSINGLDAAQRFNPDRLPETTRADIRARFGIPADSIVIGFLGRLVKDKGIEKLALAWQRLREYAPQTRLLLVGDFESEDPVSSTAREILDNDPRVHRSDYDPETPPLFAAMDVFCLPSYREGLPYVALEAAAMQLPVVTTDATGCVDAVADGITGTIVSVGDSTALEHALHRYAGDAELRNWHGAAGRQRIIRDFSPAAVWQAQLEAYLKALERANLRKPTPTAHEPATRVAA